MVNEELMILMNHRCADEVIRAEPKYGNWSVAVPMNRGHVQRGGLYSQTNFLSNDVDHKWSARPYSTGAIN